MILICVVLIAITSMTAGHFGYTLDDPYIHLALAERLASGHYGINAGEAASPSSSIIWPFLLMIGVGTPWHVYLPLFIDVACGAASILVIAHTVDRWPWRSDDCWSGVKRNGTVVLLMLAGNLVMLVFSGMEHSLQLLVVCIAAYGLSEALFGRRIPFWCLAATALGPAIRYEMLGPAMALGMALCGSRRWGAAAALVLASLSLPIAFGLYLSRLGLPFLPNSVLAKSGVFGDGRGAIESLAEIGRNAVLFIATNVQYWPFLLLLAGVAAAAVTAAKQRRWALGGVAFALAAHLLFGRFGWLYRYEDYAVMFGLLALFAAVMPDPLRSGAMAIVLLVFYAGYYAYAIYLAPTAAQNIYEQQYQMHRFANAFYRKSIAVNDLGWVIYRQRIPFYVLDLAGLGSSEALARVHKDAAWLDDITRRKNVGLAMIYPSWFEAIPSSWTEIGEIELSGPAISAAAGAVTFYATAVGNSQEIKAEFRAFAATLPPGVRAVSE
jgi:hypothetical protein